jgi:serine/threonine protein kinase
MPKQKYNLKNCNICKNCKNCKNCKKCKNYILNGGKLIGQGSYGCVFRPMIPCKGTNKRIPGKVSKFLNKNEAKDEIKENRILDRIDKKGIFHFKTPKVCDFNMNYQYEPGINDCSPFAEENNDFNRMKLLQMSDGGMELDAFLKNVKLKNKEQEYKLLLGLEPLFIGLKVMYENQFSHFDIKTLNAVINPETYQMKYIDFGLSNYNKEHYKNVFTNIYFAWPLELQLLNDYNLDLKSDGGYIFSAVKDHRYHGYIEHLSNRIGAGYAENYAHVINNKYVRNGSVYLPGATPIFIENFFDKADDDFDYITKDVISKVDVFSVGIICLMIFKKITKQKFDVAKKNKNLNKILDALYTLIKNMVQESSFLRFNGTDAHLFYETEIKALITKEVNDCPPNKIMNPKTKRCVLKTGKIGRNYVQESKSKSPANKKKDAKICPPHKIMNPKTKRCVLKTRKIGRKLVENYKPPVSKKQDAAICPPNKILNPKTKRCVLRSGGIGRKLVEKLKPMKIPNDEMSIPNCKGKKESDCKTHKNCRYVNGKKRQYCRKK